MHRRFVPTLGFFVASSVLYSVGCSGGGTGTTSTSATGTGGSSDATSTTGATGGAGGAAASTGAGTGTGGSMGPAMLDEKVLDVQLALSGATLTITVKDGSTPVMTDAWLYTLNAGVMAPLTGFADPTSKRKYRGLLMPCKVANAPTGLVPCDDGALNGIMTDAVRDTLENGVKKTAIDGTVAVTLDAAPTDTVLVIVAREDQRYAGAAAIGVDGKVATVPAGVGAPESHAIVTYTKDIKPMVAALCTSCHTNGLIADGYLLDSYENILNNDFGHFEGTGDCEAATPGDQAAIDACVAKITKTEYMIERGNPALSTLIRRTRPDEEKSASAIGAKWWGTKTGGRFDDTGDRRMPSLNTTADLTDDVAAPTYFDNNTPAFKTFWDWIAQGAVQ